MNITNIQHEEPVVIACNSYFFYENDDTNLSQKIAYDELCNTYSNEINKKLHESAKYNYYCVPPEYKDEYCIMFGGKVLFHSKDEEKTMEEYKKLSEHLTVTLCVPVVHEVSSN
ncbi:putative orfan [Tupanvirus soda lake]|uniref:Orfan n=2 Tax=Tupanvirus TaxID=2094720 RepID=A0AC62ABK3_9VIRU|nr:putative orfan [Tupanvirus soda lake]QKU35126.1 putative orfan [Tupanvirus soda lake]